MLIRSFLLVSIFLVYVHCYHPLSDEFIDEINKRATTWKAGRNFARNTPLRNLKQLLGVRPEYLKKRLPKIIHNDETVMNNLPESFDARDRWPQCDSIKKISDQGPCSSCWAVSTSDAISDRICIHSNGAQTPLISAENLMDCCSSCGKGCRGGNPAAAWKFWATDGIVSGGPYESKIGCQPYTMEPCHKDSEGLGSYCTFTANTPACQNTCIPGYNVSFEADKHYAQLAYEVDRDQKQIQYEIFTNGPVAAGFVVFSDFFQYESGVYKQVAGMMEGWHAVRIIGWGTEDGTPYWLIANTWNVDWGQNGTFKFIRGRNECLLESHVSAGIPKL